MVPGAPFSDAVAVADGKIVAVGRYGDVKRAYPWILLKTDLPTPYSFPALWRRMHISGPGASGNTCTSASTTAAPPTVGYGQA